MKLIVSVLLFMVLGAIATIPQRRQFVGYSNNIVHENPNYPDQTAQSSVKVTFNPNQLEQRALYNPHYLNQNYPTNAPQSQLFNVGYSVQFTNGNKPKPNKPKYTRINNLDNGEIITGIRKQNEEVQGPNLNLSPQDFVSAALISNKKQKISGIKPKPHFYTNYPNPKTLLNQANLSPSTQKFYKTLEHSKPQIQNIQELQQKYSWRNLGPGVEIIRSTEVPTASQKYTRSEPSLHFDHAKALGRSQDFDYSNALDSNNNIPEHTNVFFNSLKTPKATQLPSLQQVQSMAFSRMNHNIPKLPLDTSLLKEQVPIQVDTRYLEEAMKNQQLASFSKTQYNQPQESLQANYLQHPYRTIPVYEDTQNKPEQGLGFQDYQQEQNRFQDYQQEQNRFQYKIYGKPEPVMGGFNDVQSEQIQRQPRYLTDLNTNLRPPPFATTSYQRRLILG